MGKRVKNNITVLTEFAKHDKKTLRKLIMSIISLVIAGVVLATTTFSWFSVKTSKLELKQFQLDCGKGLRVNDTGTSEMSFSQVSDKYLTPASSVDGRNLFFPTDGSDFSKTTSAMTFRSANVGDKNVNYIQIDFTLTAQQNHTALYINDVDSEGNEKTSIKVRASNETSWSTSQAAALRSALWCSSEEVDGVPNTPIVFNPTNSSARTAAVAAIDRSTGAFAAEGRQVAHPFSDYAFGGTPVATLQKGVETKFSYIIWLEGTDPKCTNKILNKDIQIKLAFSTSWDKTQTIRFKDETSGSWVKDLIQNHHYSLSLHYEDTSDGSTTDFNMYKYLDNVSDANNTEWSCNIPGDMTHNISFVLHPGNSSDHVYQFTYDSRTGHEGERTFNRGSNRQYIAKKEPYVTSPNTDYGTCQGYWKALADSDGGGHDSGGDSDGDDF